MWDTFVTDIRISSGDELLDCEWEVLPKGSSDYKREKRSVRIFRGQLI